MLPFNQFTCLTFDCYGTLIDWETGIAKALHLLLEAHGVACSDDHILSLYAQLEAAEEKRSYRPYREVLKGIVIGFGDRVGFRPSLEDLESLPDSIQSWPPFPDTVAALHRLKTKYKLAIISNIDDDLFASTSRLLQVPFDWVITAQQAKSYKPSANNFRLALERIGLPKETILHVAQSRFHDIVPAKTLGFRTVWINRKAGKLAEWATQAATVEPDLEVPDLETLAEMAVGKQAC